jgi:peptide/nickel transport system ATP-binding protein
VALLGQPAGRRSQWGRGAEPEGSGSETDSLLEVRDLTVDFTNGDGPRAVQGLSLSLPPGRVIGIAGESGSGKSVSALSMIGLLPRTAQVGGSIRYRGQEMVGASDRRWRTLRGREIAMVFQETTSALNPVVTVDRQLLLAARRDGEDKAVVRERIRAALTEVGLTDVDRVLRSYPHELSGGMCQRVVIAMAVSCGSKVLLADEPTTALDVCVQQEVLSVLRTLVARHGVSVVLISHDLGVLAELCQELIVMYRGEVMEQGPTGAILRGPAHPYTAALLSSLPRLDGVATAALAPATAQLSERSDGGCPFQARCPWRVEQCAAHPELVPLGAAGPTPADVDPAAGAEVRRVRCWRGAEVHHSEMHVAVQPQGDRR